MAQRKIVWSNRARIKLWEILDFYTKRNKSTSYSKKLYKKLTGEVAKLTKHPDIGRKTDNQLIRGLVVENFILFYEVYPKMIVIHTVWDSRQDPGSLKIK